MLLLGHAGGTSVADNTAINLSFPVVATSSEQLKRARGPVWAWMSVLQPGVVA